MRCLASSTEDGFVMSDTSNSKGRDYQIPPLYAQRMREFYGRYGAFLQLWQTFELLVEIIVMRQLRLTVHQTSILCGGINFAAKISIAVSLLMEDRIKNEKAITSLKTAASVAERNDFTHSFLTHGSDGSLHLVRREVRREGYSVDVRIMTVTEMQRHGEAFAGAFENAAVELKISETDVDAYAREIESRA
jgi:hypothetical protein